MSANHSTKKHLFRINAAGAIRNASVTILRRSDVAGAWQPELVNSDEHIDTASTEHPGDHDDR